MKRIVKSNDLEIIFEDTKLTYTPLEKNTQLTTYYDDIISIKVVDKEIIMRIKDEQNTFNTYTITFDSQYEKEVQAIIKVINKNISINENHENVNDQVELLEKEDKVTKVNRITAIILYISSILTFIYLIYIFYTLYQATQMPTESSNPFFEAGAKLGVIIALKAMLPHTITLVISMTLNVIAAISKNWIVCLVSALLYILSIAFFPSAFMNVTVQFIICVISTIIFYKNK